MKRGVIIGLIICCWQTAPAQYADTVRTVRPLIEKLHDLYEPLQVWQNQSLASNPAMALYNTLPNYTRVSAGYQRSSHDLYIGQTGNGRSLTGLEAQAFYRSGPYQALWGQAGYQKGVNKHMRWNETSDYQILAPYVTADSVGGDMDTEDYTFSGGYTRQAGSLSFGLEAAYTAKLDYRDLDPRPKNTVSDLGIRVGVAKSVLRNDVIGFFVSFRKYTQDNSLQFYNPVSRPKVYHMVGLGVDNKLLSGKYTDTYYDGKGIGAGFQLTPVSGTGFLFQAAYDRFGFDKLLLSLRALPVAEMHQGTFNAEAGYEANGSSGYRWRLNGYIRHQIGKGTEYLFENRSASDYVQIGETQSYDVLETHYGIRGVFGRNLRGRASVWCYAMPQLGINDQQEHYNVDHRAMTNRNMTASLCVAVHGILKDMVFSIQAAVAMQRNLSKDFYTGSLEKTGSLYSLLNDNYSFMTTARDTFLLDLRLDYPLSDGQVLFVSPGAGYVRYGSDKYGRNMHFSVGMSF